MSAQLDSYLGQAWQRWDLLVGDDGASEQDLAVLSRFRRIAGPLGHQVEIRQGPRRGFACNYLTMLRDLPPDTDFVALSDQDDIWLAPKLERAVRALGQVEGPGLYCGARLIWDPVRNTRRSSRPLRGGPSFHNALVENIACGNTIVLNRAALHLIQRGLALTDIALTDAVPFHDWWIYLLISGAGGHVLHDPDPQVLYRQHPGNALGAGEAGWNWIRARRDVSEGVYRDRLERNLVAISAQRWLLTSAHQDLLDRFIAARRAPWPLRLRLIAGLGLYRQDALSQLGLWGAIAFARL
ncbi:MAG: hypothetical protein B7X55_00230 [Rhodobacterales bacterium 34-62-10]|nr:MAG: hypothetical protein B7X55_00230 [Rhodobacterales bacterium 34-62-10]